MNFLPSVIICKAVLGKEWLFLLIQTRTNKKSTPRCCKNSKTAQREWMLEICHPGQQDYPERPNATEASITFTWKRKLEKDFCSCLCSTETPFSFKFTMSCFDIILLIQSAMYFPVQGWIIWQNKTHWVSQISVSLGIFQAFNTAPVLPSAAACSKQCHSAGRTHSAHPNAFLVLTGNRAMAACPASINVCRFPLLRAGICKWDISQNALERSHHDQATFCLFCFLSQYQQPLTNRTFPWWLFPVTDSFQETGHSPHSFLMKGHFVN